MKKCWTILLAGLALLCCRGLAEEPAKNRAGDEKIALTAFQYSLENQNADFNHLWFFEALEEKTGVHVDFRMVKDADWLTQVNLMFAVPDDMPDMILRNPVDEEDYGVTQGLLLPLDEYLTEEIMPNYVRRLRESGAGDTIPASDGKTYFIGYLMAQNVNHNGTWYVDRKELEKLGLAVPQTIAELTETLRAMKADGVRYPFSASFSLYGPETLWNQFACFGVPENTYYYYIDAEEQVRFTAWQPGYRACLEWLHQLYAEGLMDPESLTQDSNLWVNKVNAGEVGYFCYLRLQNTAILPQKTDSFQAILPPVAEGYSVAVSRILEIPTAGAYLTSSCWDPKAALSWIDAQLETETMMVALNGRLGEQIVQNDAGKYEVIDIPENNGLFDFVPVTMGQFFAPGEYYSAIYQMAPHRVERYEDSEWYEKAGVLEYKSFQYLRDVVKLDAEKAVEADDLRRELQKYIEEAVVDFIRNGVTDEKWERFVKTTKGIGAERYITMFQEAYDAYRGQPGS